MVGWGGKICFHYSIADVTVFKATLLDGAFHDVDSSALAFEIAARACAKQGLKQAGLRLMEPIMQV